jgi:signal transduction histidine kinase
VCRAIAIAHDGTITAIRRDGGGATFRVWLPGGDAPTLADAEP